MWGEWEDLEKEEEEEEGWKVQFTISHYVPFFWWRFSSWLYLCNEGVEEKKNKTKSAFFFSQDNQEQ